MTTPTSKRTTSPAFQFYPKDFLTSPKVMNMTATERGIYITLLCVCWLEGGLPDDVKQLAGFARVPFKQFARIWPHNLQGCFVLARNGLLVNERLDKERRKQLEYRRRQSDYGKKGGRRVALGSAKGSPSPRELETADADVLQVASSSSEGSPRGTPPMDIWARELVNLYPAQGRCGWNLVERPLFDALTGNGGDPWAGWDMLRGSLEAHKRSHQWRVKQMIPRLDKWLREGLYLQELPEAPVTTLVNDRNARSLSSAAEFIKAGERGTH